MRDEPVELREEEIEGVTGGKSLGVDPNGGTYSDSSSYIDPNG